MSKQPTTEGQARTKIKMKTKICNNCNKEKLLSEFPVKRKFPLRYQAKCKECFKELYKNTDRYRQYRRKYESQLKQNKKEYKLRMKRSNYYSLAKKLNCSVEHIMEIYNNLFNEQQGYCAICGIHQSEKTKAFALDHNHETNQIRGLLCNKCNLAIGLLDDSEGVCLNAVEYLFNYKEEN